METTVKLKEQIGKFNPCRESVVWMGDRTLAQAWDDCERGDWLLWLCAKAGVDKKKIVLAACGCARLVLHLVAEDEPRPRLAIETAEAWCRGEATIHDVKAAYADADADARRIMQRKCGEVVREFITARDVGHALTGN